MSAVQSVAFVRAAIHSFSVISKLSIFITVVSYVLFGHAITARKVFVVSSFFNILNTSMLVFWPTSLAYGYETTHAHTLIYESNWKFLNQRREKVHFQPEIYVAQSWFNRDFDQLLMITVFNVF